jgi:hypothetical protein
MCVRKILGIGENYFVPEEHKSVVDFFSVHLCVLCDSVVHSHF